MAWGYYEQHLEGSVLRIELNVLSKPLLNTVVDCLAAAMLGLLLAGCAESGSQAGNNNSSRGLSDQDAADASRLAASSLAQEKSGDSPGFDIRTDMPMLMERVLNHSAEVIWDSAGFIITAEGEQDLAPTTDQGWEAVAAAATVLMESGNLLILPGRSQGDAWDAYAKLLILASENALVAAEAQDATALFDAGGHIYEVCRACHNQYWINFEEGFD